MPGILLDTHALYWLVTGDASFRQEARAAISQNQLARTLFVSPVSAWELSTASQKPVVAGRPNLGKEPPELWFRRAIRSTKSRIVPIHQRIAIEAAAVATATRHKDPGDCFLIATARVRHLSIVTRDGPMHRIAKDNPGYLDVIAC